MSFVGRGISMPVQLLFVVFFSILFGDKLPIELKEILYSLSLLIKSGLVFMLPWIIFSCIYSSILEMQVKGALSTLFIILIGICISNLMSTLVAFSVAQVFSLPNLNIENIAVGSQEKLNVLFSVDLKPFISVDKALFSGIIAGIVAKLVNNKTDKFIWLGKKMRAGSHVFLNQIFVPVIPLFVLGFSLQLQHERVLDILFKKYSLSLGIVLVVLAGYLGTLYIVASNGSFQRLKNSLNQMFPAIMSGFSTMSSMAALPLTLKASEKNTENPALARVTVPMTVNNHLVGDSIFIPFVGILLAAGHQNVQVEFGQFLVFAFYFVMAKFAVAAVPGGGILVMIPILERHLGLSSELLSLMTALYVLFDPVITSANVAGNGAFAILISRVMKKLAPATGLRS